MASSTTKDLMQEYHRLAADTLLGQAPNKVAIAILDTAKDGQVDRLQKLLSEYSYHVDVRDPESGDTPLITAARNGYEEVVDLLLRHGADVTLENDNRDSVLDVVGEGLRRHILKSIQHEDRSMSNAKALLQSAWIGDAVSLKRYLSGSHYLDVNTNNKDGLTPLLLVTRDVSFFSAVQSGLEYNPVDVLEQLLTNHANVNQTDKYGCGPLHMIASSGDSIHATKMVSLLLQHGSIPDAQLGSSQSPLHMASSHGHMTVIVALVEDGGADINLQTTDTGDTALMLSVRGGHNEATRYLLNRGADVTIVTESGDSALSVANSPRMRRMIKEAWTEQAECVTQATSESGDVDNDQGSPVISPGQPDKPSFFLTDRQISKSLDFESAELIDRGKGTLSSTPLLQRDSPQRTHDQTSHDQTSHDQTSHDQTSHDQTSHDIRGEGAESVVSEGEGDVVIREKMKEKKTRRRVKSETIVRDQRERGRGDSVAVQDGRVVQSGDVAVQSEKDKFTKTQSEDRRTGVAQSRLTMAPEQLKTEVVVRKRRQMKKKMTKSVSTPTTTHKKPSTLLTQRSRSQKLSRDNHVTRSSQLQLFPEVVTFSSPPSPKPSVTPYHHHDNKLPDISKMRAVAMVSVDTRTDKLSVCRFGSSSGSHGNSGSDSPLQRSRSMITASGVKSHNAVKKKNSTGSITTTQPPYPAHGSSAATNRPVQLRPHVVAPQLFTQPVTTSHQQSAQYGRWRLSEPPQPPQGPFQGNLNIQPSLIPSLSIVNEDSESLASSTSLLAPPATPLSSHSDQSLLSRQTSSEGSTLKANSHSEFEIDSLDRKTATQNSPLQDTPPQNTPLQDTALWTHHRVSSTRPCSTIRSTMSRQSHLPPTIDQFYQLTRQLSTASHTPSSNTLTHYAVQDGSMPLSPIWNQTSSKSHSEASTTEEYITSFVSGPATEAMGVPVPDPHVPTAGLDSGQGESTDEEKVESSSSSEAEPLEIHCLQWKRGKLLGKGAFGKVWEGLLDSAKLIAVKEVELDIAGQKAQSQYEKLRIEVEILRSLRHRNVVHYLGTSMDEFQVYIFMEYISGGSLQSILKRFGPLDDKTSIHYTRQIVQALNYLHSNGIVHRDIKGANVMVTSRGVVKLIDFGCAKQSCQEVSGEMRSVRGTPYWMAPEVIRGDGYGRKSDIWSLGCTVHEMATSKPPWADHAPETAIFQIGSGRAIPPLPAHLSHGITSFILRCVVRDPIQRPGADTLLNDSFLTKLIKKRKH